MRDHDNLWTKRTGQIDTQTIFDCLTDSTIKNTGISTCIQLSQKFSHMSMLKARNKIYRNLFYPNLTGLKKITVIDHNLHLEIPRVQ